MKNPSNFSSLIIHLIIYTSKNKVLIFYSLVLKNYNKILKKFSKYIELSKYKNTVIIILKALNILSMYVEKYHSRITSVTRYSRLEILVYFVASMA